MESRKICELLEASLRSIGEIPTKYNYDGKELGPTKPEKGERKKMKKVFAIVVVCALMLTLLPATAVVGAVASITVTPDVGVNMVNTSHTITADVDPDGEYTVHFEITSGPNADMSADVATNEYGEASWTYTSEVSGIDTIQVSVTSLSLSTEVTKYWLTDRVNTGGKIIQEHGNKKKDWYKITWGGWVGNCTVPMGSFTATFHNISVDAYDKATFITDGIVELASLEYYYVSLIDDADPPESTCNVAEFRMFGDLLDRHGNPMDGNWLLTVGLTDGGEPGPLDTIYFELWDGPYWEGGTCVYASYPTPTPGDPAIYPGGDFEEVFPGAIVHVLDSGNVQIVVPYEL